MKEAVNLIIAAMEEEVSAIYERLNKDNIKVENIDLNGDKGSIFERKEKKYLIVRGKIGKVHTAFMLGLLSQRYDIKSIYNIGSCGTFSLNVNLLDVVIAKEVLYADVDVSGFNYPLGQMPGCPKSFKMPKIDIGEEGEGFKIHYGLMMSGDSFITNSNVSEFIKEQKPLAIDMESGAVAQCGYLLNVPVYIIRSITDCILLENNDKTFDEMLVAASHNSVATLFSLI